MTQGIELTFQCLGRTRNAAANELLTASLESPVAEIRTAALEGLLQRHGKVAQNAIFDRWPLLLEAEKERVARTCGALESALRDALNSRDDGRFHIACEAIVRCREYETLPLLLRIATQRNTDRADAAAFTLVQLVALLRQELDRLDQRSGRRSPEQIRAQSIEALEGAVRDFREGDNPQVLEAYLMLISRENALFREVMRSPAEPSHAVILDLLRHSTHPAVIGLILSCLEDPTPLTPLLPLAGMRYDGAFLSQWFRHLSRQMSPEIKQNLGKVRDFAWAGRHRKVLTKLSGPQQGVALEVLTASGIAPKHRHDTILFIATEGELEGRVAALECLAGFHDVQSTNLVLQAIEDENPSIRATALGQIRARGIPGAIKLLLEHLDSDDLEVQQAVRQSLLDFNFPAYLAAYDKMSEGTRISTGNLVARIDLQTPDHLQRELESDSTFRQLRACEIIGLLHLEAAMEDVLHQTLAEGDQPLRVRAAELLAGCPTQATRQVLREAVLDRNSRVRESAEASLRQIVSPAVQAGVDSSSVDSFSNPSDDLSLRS